MAPHAPPPAMKGGGPDHLGYPYSICRHVNPEDSPLDQVRTGASVIMDLEDGVL